MSNSQASFWCRARHVFFLVHSPSNQASPPITFPCPRPKQRWKRPRFGFWPQNIWNIADVSGRDVRGTTSFRSLVFHSHQCSSPASCSVFARWLKHIIFRHVKSRGPRLSSRRDGSGTREVNGHGRVFTSRARSRDLRDDR